MVKFRALKRNLKKAIVSSPFLLSRVNKWLGDFPRVFLYHRFCREDELLPHRVSAEKFRWQLEQIASRYHVVSFGECVQHYAAKGRWPEKCAVITVDDGYRDFYEIAFPELQRLSLPATFFVTVNFVDQQLWLWPDRLHYAIEKSSSGYLKINLDNQVKIISLGNEKEKFRAWKCLSEICISLDDCSKEKVITAVVENLEVHLPVVPTIEYAAVTWGELSKMHRAGIEIGSHTMNHPILSRIDRGQLRHEVFTSRTILEDKLQAPIRTFCYPNGQPGDINDEVIKTVRDAGYVGAPYFFDLAKWDPFLVPRMGVSNDRNDFLAKLAGLEITGIKLKKAFGSNNR